MVGGAGPPGKSIGRLFTCRIECAPGIDTPSENCQRTAGPRKIIKPQDAAQRRPFPPIPSSNVPSADGAGMSELSCRIQIAGIRSQCKDLSINPVAHSLPLVAVPSGDAHGLDSSRPAEAAAGTKTIAACCQRKHNAIDAAAEWRPSGAVPLRNTARADPGCV